MSNRKSSLRARAAGGHTVFLEGDVGLPPVKRVKLLRGILAVWSPQANSVDEQVKLIIELARAARRDPGVAQRIAAQLGTYQFRVTRALAPYAPSRFGDEARLTRELVRLLQEHPIPPVTKTGAAKRGARTEYVVIDGKAVPKPLIGTQGRSITRQA